MAPVAVRVGMYHRMLCDIICQTFKDEVGNWQIKKNRQQGLQIHLRTKTNFDKEEGYRGVKILIYGPMNYVGVYLQETWDVISKEDMEDDDSGEYVPKEGKDYVKGQSEWKCLCYHDSEWRSTLADYLWQNRDTINGFNHPFKKFYEMVDVPEEVIKKS